MLRRDMALVSNLSYVQSSTDCTLVRAILPSFLCRSNRLKNNYIFMVYTITGAYTNAGEYIL